MAAVEDITACRTILAQVLRQTVISRLRLAHEGPGAIRGGDPGDRESAGEPVQGDHAASDLVALLRSGAMAESDACADLIVDQRGGLDAFFLDIAPRVATALHLCDTDGEAAIQWREGEWRLQELIDRLGPRFTADHPTARHGRRALLTTPMPGRHRLHLRITAECFTRDGWDAWCAPRALADAVQMVRTEWFSMIMIAAEAACEDQLAGMIHALRRASCNPELRVLVMDDALARRPKRLAQLGVDAAASDIRQACSQARRLLTMMPPTP